jgi:hypothetical protein
MSLILIVVRCKSKRCRRHSPPLWQQGIIHPWPAGERRYHQHRARSSKQRHWSRSRVRQLREGNGNGSQQPPLGGEAYLHSWRRGLSALMEARPMSTHGRRGLSALMEARSISTHGLNDSTHQIRSRLCRQGRQGRRGSGRKRGGEGYVRSAPNSTDMTPLKQLRQCAPCV